MPYNITKEKEELLAGGNNSSIHALLQIQPHLSMIMVNFISPLIHIVKENNSIWNNFT
jgi:hypothetical protein